MSSETNEEEKAEIAAIFARLKEEIRKGAPVEDDAGTRPAGDALPSRARAGRSWAVTAERPFEQPPTRRRRVQAYLFVPAKRVLRKMMRWYVEPVAVQQRSFNLTILTLVDELTERVGADVSRLERRLEALEERVSSDRTESSG